MIGLSICKNLCRARPRLFTGSLARSACGVVANGPSSVYADRADHRLSEKPIFQQRRLYSAESQAKRVLLPPLCDFPVVMWPRFFKILYNSFLLNMIMKPFGELDFNINDFITASKHAIQVVSEALAREDYDQLEGLVTNDVVQGLRQKIGTLDSQQKELIAVNEEDIYMAFPYEVSLLFDEERKEKFVEIMVVTHVLRGLAEMRARGESPPINMGIMPEYQERIFICNYRFRRYWTKDEDSPWIINMVNHFMPIALV